VAQPLVALQTKVLEEQPEPLGITVMCQAVILVCTLTVAGKVAEEEPVEPMPTAVVGVAVALAEKEQT